MDEYEKYLSPEKVKKLKEALDIGITAQNQVKFTLGMVENLIILIDNNKTGSISTDTVRSWVKSLISGLKDI